MFGKCRPGMVFFCVCLHAFRSAEQSGVSDAIASRPNCSHAQPGIPNPSSAGSFLSLFLVQFAFPFPAVDLKAISESGSWTIWIPAQQGAQFGTGRMCSSCLSARVVIFSTQATPPAKRISTGNNQLNRA